MSNPVSKETYTVGWISALPIELAAATEMLDEEHPTPPSDRGDDGIYTLGRIGDHNVVIACLPGGQMGISAATAVATKLLSKFPTVKVGFMVGIGGGVPRDGVDIRLGDVVVSLPHLDHGGVVQYDFGKEEAGANFRRTGHLNTPPKLLLSVVNLARSNYERGRSTYNSHLTKFDEEPQLRRFSRAKTGLDRLFASDYTHAGGPTCDECRSEMLVKRQSRDDDELVQVHYGTIASGNRVIKDAATRDNIVQSLGGDILCFEMEAAGLMNDFPCLVIRGICDYSDSHKQDHWQRYAAATAAAYTKEILSLLPSADVTSLRPIQSAWLVPFHRNAHFTGRRKVLSQLDKHLNAPDPPPRVALYGLGGTGKSAVALEFAYRIRDRQMHRAVFWVPAIDLDRFKQAYREIARSLEIPGAESTEEDMLYSVGRKLTDEATGHWLMIVDNADDPELLFRRGPLTRPLWECLPQSRWGMIIFTSRDKKTAIDLADSSIISIVALKHREAEDLFLGSISSQETRAKASSDSLRKLLKELTYFPLAIVQATAFINQNSIEVEDYIQLFHNSQNQGSGDQIAALFSEGFRDHQRYPGMENAVFKTWQISFRHLQSRDTNAVECLSFIACIAPKDIPKTLLLPDKPDLDRTKSIGTLVAYRFLTEQKESTLVHMHPLVHFAMEIWLKRDNQLDHWKRRAADQLNGLMASNGYERLAECRLYLPHSIRLVGLFERKQSRGQTHKSLLFYPRKRLKLMNRDGTFDEADSVAVDLLARVGTCQFQLGNHVKAEESHQKVLKWRRINLGSENEKTLAAMNMTALDMEYQRRFAGAEELLLEEMQLEANVFGPEHRRTLLTMTSVVRVYAYLERWEEAEGIGIRILKTSTRVFGIDDSITIASMSGLAFVYRGQGRWNEAEDLYRKALDRGYRAGTIKHPDTLSNMTNLAHTYQEQDRWAEAEDLVLQALDLEKRVLGEEHPVTLDSMRQLANIFKRQDKDEAAISILATYVDFSVKVLPPRHPNLVLSTQQLNEWRSQHGNVAATHKYDTAWKKELKEDIQVPGKAANSRSSGDSEDLEDSEDSEEPSSESVEEAIPASWPQQPYTTMPNPVDQDQGQKQTSQTSYSQWVQERIAHKYRPSQANKPPAQKNVHPTGRMPKQNPDRKPKVVDFIFTQERKPIFHVEKPQSKPKAGSQSHLKPHPHASTPKYRNPEEKQTNTDHPTHQSKSTTVPDGKLSQAQGDQMQQKDDEGAKDHQDSTKVDVEVEGTFQDRPKKKSKKNNHDKESKTHKIFNESDKKVAKEPAEEHDRGKPNRKKAEGHEPDGKLEANLGGIEKTATIPENTQGKKVSPEGDSVKQAQKHSKTTNANHATKPLANQSLKRPAIKKDIGEKMQGKKPGAPAVGANKSDLGHSKEQKGGSMTGNVGSSSGKSIELDHAAATEPLPEESLKKRFGAKSVHQGRHPPKDVPQESDVALPESGLSTRPDEDQQEPSLEGINKDPKSGNPSPTASSVSAAASPSRDDPKDTQSPSVSSMPSGKPPPHHHDQSLPPSKGPSPSHNNSTPSENAQQSNLPKPPPQVPSPPPQVPSPPPQIPQVPPSPAASPPPPTPLLPPPTTETPQPPTLPTKASPPPSPPPSPTSNPKSPPKPQKRKPRTPTSGKLLYLYSDKVGREPGRVKWILPKGLSTGNEFKDRLVRRALMSLT